MSSQKTNRFHLHRWAPEDTFLREEFNENFTLIEGAVVAGSYIGDGQARRFIALPFTPAAVLIVRSDGEVSYGNSGHGGLTVTGKPLRSDLAEVAEGGSYVSTGYSTNSINSGGEFYYLAFR